MSHHENDIKSPRHDADLLDFQTLDTFFHAMNAGEELPLNSVADNRYHSSVQTDNTARFSHAEVVDPKTRLQYSHHYHHIHLKVTRQA